jgi:thiol-disulfide isomerase/thioredoxin
MNLHSPPPAAAPANPTDAQTAHAAEVQAALAGVPRRALLAAAAVTVVGAGVATAWMHSARDALPPVTGAVPAFWALKWSTPAGAALAMQSFKGRPLLINFWATWCPPCVEELPLINAFFQENQAKGWQVLGLAVDKPAQVQAFLRRSPLAFPVAMAGFDGTELSRSLGNLSGGLPFSLALDATGGIIQRKMGRLVLADLALLRGLE